MSAFYDQSSLVFLPSGYKDGKLYSQKPLSTSGELSFSRGSDIEATRIGADGLIHKAQVNLLLQSNTFNTTWVLSNTTLTGGQTGYDGTSNAWLLEVSAGGTYRRISQNTNVNAVMTNSIYAKAGTVDFIAVTDTSGSTSNVVFFDLANGVIDSITNAGQIIDAQIESVGGGWYRCSAALTGNTSGTALWFVSATGGSNSNAGDNVYIQDAAQCYGLVAQTYQETTTAAVVSGITDNMPRLNYDPANPTCPSLLLEPSRLNVLPQSEYYGASWSVVNANLTTNDTTSPEGVVNASKVVTTSSTAAARLEIFPTLSDNTNYALSAFVKKGNVNWCFIGLRTKGGVTTNVFFDLVNGVAGTTAGSPISYGIEDYGNDWYRVHLVQDSSSGGTTPRVQLGVANADGVYTSSVDDYVYFYGAQCEAGSYVSSMVPTYGSSATRTADDMDTTFASAFATDGGATFFIELKGAPISAQNSNTRNFSLDFASGDYITYNHGSTSAHRLKVEASGTAYYSTAGISNVLQDEDVKMAAAVTSTSVVMYVNGQEAVNTSLVGDWNSATLLRTTIQDLIGIVPVKQFIFFPTSLTATQLAELTTL